MNKAEISAEIIAIGDELTSGVRLDTNTQWISRALGELGVHVRWHTSVCDQLEDIVNALRIASKRAAIIITSGGLGPTADDLTREALAELAGVPLVLHEPSMKHIEQLFAARKRPMPERNRVQAMLPTGASVIPNPHGSAPGIAMQLDTSEQAAGQGGEVDTSPRSVRIFSLPGVPAELFEMWESVRQTIGAVLPQQRTTLHHELHCFGAGESDVEAMLPDLVRRGRDPSVGITASQATITLRVTASGDNSQHCRDQMAPTIDIIRESLGEIVFGENGATLEDVVLAQLSANNQTMATLEVGSAGLLAQWLTHVEKAAVAYRGGVVRTTSQWAEIEESPELTMAEFLCAALRESSADWMLAVGPYPEAASKRNTTSEFLVALVAREPLAGETTGQQDGLHYFIRAYSYASHPAIAETRAAKIALNALRKELLKSAASKSMTQP